MITQTKNSTNKIYPDDSRYKEMPFVAVISKFYPNTLEFCSNKLFNSNNTIKFVSVSAHSYSQAHNALLDPTDIFTMLCYMIHVSSSKVWKRLSCTFQEHRVCTLEGE